MSVKEMGVLLEEFINNVAEGMLSLSVKKRFLISMQEKEINKMDFQKITFKFEGNKPYRIIVNNSARTYEEQLVEYCM